MRFASIVGARPNFVKMAPLIKEILRRGEEHILVHTGQHYDRNMSDIFFEEQELPPIDHHLDIGSGSHGEQTGRMLIGIEKILMERKPDVVIVPGDTNTTVAGALASVKLGIKTAHIEAGLRSFDRTMPEEINRIITDHVSDFLFAPTDEAVKNLEKEGLKGHLVGDTMLEAVLNNAELAQKKFPVPKSRFYLATIHRASNTDDPKKLKAIFKGLKDLGNVVLPIHPRTKKMVVDYGISTDGIDIREPMSYMEFLSHMVSAELVITDSGGVQKESMLLETPLVTVRDNTEWVETIDLGWNVLSGADEIPMKVKEVLDKKRVEPKDVYGDGRASEHIIDIIAGSF